MNTRGGDAPRSRPGQGEDNLEGRSCFTALSIYSLGLLILSKR